MKEFIREKDIKIWDVLEMDRYIGLPFKLKYTVRQGLSTYSGEKYEGYGLLESTSNDKLNFIVTSIPFWGEITFDSDLAFGRNSAHISPYDDIEEMYSLA